MAHGCDGRLFHGRFKSILVDADSYVLQLIRYIHRNPLEAGLVKRLDRYSWSSHKSYLSKAKKWNWLNRYSSVSSVVMRVREKLQKDRKFRDRLSQIENNISKSQR